MLPGGKPPPDLFELRPAVPVKRQEAAQSPFPGRRLVIVYLLALSSALLFRFPAWAVLALPLAAGVTQLVCRLRWPYRIASAAVFATYLAQLSAVIVSPAGWGFRFTSMFVFCLAGAFCWGLRMD
jgi:hypothetical protein